MTRIGLLGCGSWGTTLAQILAKKVKLSTLGTIEKILLMPSDFLG